MKRFIYLSRDTRLPEAIERYLVHAPGTSLTRYERPQEVLKALNRGVVDLLVLDADHDFVEVADLCERLKGDPFNQVVPLIVYSREHQIDDIAAAFERGADEFLSGTHSVREQALRIEMVLKRTERDVSLHPSTMLPGTKIIQRDIANRIERADKFAVCYADIDSFKEFNDKYSYHRGDRVIWILSMILRDIVRRLSASGFVGHIGGDDFIYTLPCEDLETVSNAILETFDVLMPLQYDREDRDRGFYVAEDRGGNVREIALMTLSIGCVTNVRRTFSHPARVSELAAEMKSYAKSKPGSLFAVDRRRDRRTGMTGESEHDAT